VLRGVTEDKAIGRFDEGLQRLYMEFSKGQHENWQTFAGKPQGRDFFRPGPLMRALECDRPCVLLIDELDKVDEGFEAMLLEILSAWTLSIPEFGTVSAKSIPFVVLTSNEERRLGDPIRRRSLYVRVEHPTPEREAEIIAAALQRLMRRFTGRWRDCALVPQLFSRNRAVHLPIKQAADQEFVSNSLCTLLAREEGELTPNLFAFPCSRRRAAIRAFVRRDSLRYHP